MGVLGLYGGPYIKKVRDPNLQRFPKASDILLEIIFTPTLKNFSSIKNGTGQQTRCSCMGVRATYKKGRVFRHSNV
jgi:hypothetical protein